MEAFLQMDDQRGLGSLGITLGDRGQNSGVFLIDLLQVGAVAARRLAMFEHEFEIDALYHRFQKTREVGIAGGAGDCKMEFEIGAGLDLGIVRHQVFKVVIGAGNFASASGVRLDAARATDWISTPSRNSRICIAERMSSMRLISKLRVFASFSLT